MESAKRLRTTGVHEDSDPTSQKRDVGHPGTLAPLRMTNWSLNPKRFLANLKEA